MSDVSAGSSGLTDPLHCAVPTSSEWTTVNAGEALPGVATPLTWTWYAGAVEDATRGAFVDLGALPRSASPIPDDVDQHFANMFYGRLVLNVDLFRQVSASMPGSSAESFDEQFFGVGRQSRSTKGALNLRRVPAILTRLPVNAIRSARAIDRYATEIDFWWQEQVNADDRSADELRSALRDAFDRWRAVVRAHALISFVAQGLYEQLRVLCEKAGCPGLEMRLVRGVDEVYEAGTVSDLGHVARGDLTMNQFLSVHGFHGPAEGELSSQSWRENPRPLESLLAAYRRKGAPEPEPGRSRAEQHGQAFAELRANLSRRDRAKAAVLVRLTRRYVPLREKGRSTFLKTYDVARCLARQLGDIAVADGRLRDREDIFLLTLEELLSPIGDVQADVDFRRARHREYLTLECPSRFRGQPSPVKSAPRDSSAQSAEPIKALGVSPGVAQGRALVLTRADEVEDVDEDHILVCHVTDPSWAALFYTVAACVIDIGGPMSHGAILARELGLPCVIGTGNGTHRLRTGDLIRVDGGAGTVQILGAAPAHDPNRSDVLRST